MECVRLCNWPGISGNLPQVVLNQKIHTNLEHIRLRLIQQIWRRIFLWSVYKLSENGIHVNASILTILKSHCAFIIFSISYYSLLEKTSPSDFLFDWSEKSDGARNKIMTSPPPPKKCLTHYHEPKYRMYLLLRKTLQLGRTPCSGSNR